MSDEELRKKLDKLDLCTFITFLLCLVNLALTLGMTIGRCK